MSAMIPTGESGTHWRTNGGMDQGKATGIHAPGRFTQKWADGPGE
ncbi:hypothetical protein GCM10007416_32460 [Kroppenstedtia guangzhouensis]|uniref:Uncharacterized protein n=1 Tax=Kroppenstedtia guangzhouensis TaxID=1274356 RepID=A0ABQ1H447_9BACL|nr:hypothetical protein [Kroppenstedtia guangzhouensis]GGA56746.1 hypothetical protein GCM10007416_32460 [Kroppenstedtia guangzhouensis]